MQIIAKYDPKPPQTLTCTYRANRQRTHVQAVWTNLRIKRSPAPRAARPSPTRGGTIACAQSLVPESIRAAKSIPIVRTFEGQSCMTSVLPMVYEHREHSPAVRVGIVFACVRAVRLLSCNHRISWTPIGTTSPSRSGRVVAVFILSYRRFPPSELSRRVEQ